MTDRFVAAASRAARWAMAVGSLALLSGCPSAATPIVQPRSAAPLRTLAVDPAVTVEQVGAAGLVESSEVWVSPDGGTLLFTGTGESSGYARRIMGLDVASGNVTAYVRVAEGQLHDPAWLPTPGAFLFVDGTAVSRNVWRSRIGRHDPGAPSETFTVLTTAMAADHIGALHVASDGVRLLLDTKDHVALGRIDSKEVTPLAVGMQPTWTPDTKRIAYVTFDGKRSFRIMVREDDGRTWPLVESSDAATFCPAFSPDGASIAYLRQGESRSEIWLVPASPGGAGRPLVRGIETLGCPAWAPDGAFYVVASSFQTGRGKVLSRVRLAR